MNGSLALARGPIYQVRLPHQFCPFNESVKQGELILAKLDL
jgi:hypothetical protein